MDTNIIDAATATAALNKIRADVALALDESFTTADALREAIVSVRPSGVLTVDEMAEAVGRERNYIDSVWSSYGDTTQGKQTRVAVDAPERAKEQAAKLLSDAVRYKLAAAAALGVLRAERNRIVTMVYGSKILGPSAIAAEVGMDRNHVLRLARKAGLTPAWRAAGTSRNQHTRKV